MTLIKLLHAKLLELQKNPPVESLFGICSQLDPLSSATNEPRAVYDELLDEAFTTWEKFSGSIMFPVPCPHGSRPSETFTYSTDMWNKDTEYGALRLELVDHMVKHFAEKLKSV